MVYCLAIMKKVAIGLAVIVGIGVLLFAIAGKSYNRLVKLSQGVDASWA